MISLTSVTDKYIIQPALVNKHRKTLEWLSASVLWKNELVFFQKLFDQNLPKAPSPNDKKKIVHFQSILLYYKNELIDSLTSRLRLHEKNLSKMLETCGESKTEYFKEYDDLMSELESFSGQFIKYKEELFSFIGNVL